MTTTAEAFAAIRARLEAAAITGLTLRWQGEFYAGDPPDAPADFCLTELLVESQRIIETGGGAGFNRLRNEARVEARVFLTAGIGAEAAATTAELVAAVFRNQSFSGVVCRAASVAPETTPEGFGNYTIALVTVDCHYDQLG